MVSLRSAATPVGVEPGRLSGPAGVESGPQTPGEVLAEVRELRRLADQVEALILRRACEWADLHPAGPDDDPAFDDDQLPAVAWDAPAELGLALGMSHDTGTGLIHEALEIRHRLPRVWALVQTAALPVWRARRIAQHTVGRPADVAAHLDTLLTDPRTQAALRVGPITLSRLIEETMLRLHPEEAEQARLDARHSRHARLHSPDPATGIAEMDIRADLPDLLDFDAALSQIAAVLADPTLAQTHGHLAGDPEGHHDTLDVRRSRAVGVLADPARALTLLTLLTSSHHRPDEHTPGHTPEHPQPDSTQPDSTEPARPISARPASAGPRRQVVLHLHLSAEALRGYEVVGRCQTGGGTGIPVLEETIRSWCGRTDTHLRVMPVVDLTDHAHTGAYEIPDRLKTRVDLRDGHCVFPRCTRPAAACDHDHRIPYDTGGATCECNLAPLCRRHHRHKTHTGWRYATLDPGTYLWTAPHGDQYLRDHTGTRNLTPTHPPHWDGCHHTDAAAPDPPGDPPIASG